MKFSKSILFTAAMFALCSLAARADTIFNVSGSLNDGASLGGTLTIDTVAGRVTGSNITASAPDSFVFTNIVSQNNNYGPGYTLIFDSTADGKAELNYNIYQPLVGITYGSASANIYFQSSGTYGALGSLRFSLPAPVTTVTPEPSSVMLLGTGLMGVMCLAFRRRGLVA